MCIQLPGYIFCPVVGLTLVVWLDLPGMCPLTTHRPWGGGGVEGGGTGSKAAGRLGWTGGIRADCAVEFAEGASGGGSANQTRRGRGGRFALACCLLAGLGEADVGDAQLDDRCRPSDSMKRPHSTYRRMGEEGMGISV